MLKSIFYFALLLILISGCNKQEEVKPINESKDTVRRTPVKDTVVSFDSSGKLFEGLYVHNANSNSFRDCANPDSSYWIIDETKKLKDLYEKFHSSQNIYGVVFAKLKGIKSETTNGKVKDKYPQTLTVKEIVEIQKKSSTNTCIPYDFWGLGNEPNWSLQISERENMIEFFDLAENKEYYFNYEENIDENGKIVYASHNNIQRTTIKIYITPGGCSDTMSDNQYDYSVEVYLNNDKRYHGCGIKGRK